MATVSLFLDNNMAAVTSFENTLLRPTLIGNESDGQEELQRKEQIKQVICDVIAGAWGKKF